MPKLVFAKEGDTLCTIAIAQGFLNCDKLRAHPDNKDLLNRPLRTDDAVTVPDLKPKQKTKGVDAKHPFKRQGVPVPKLRFVHGSKHLPPRDDKKLKFLNVSNYVSNLAGMDGQQPFTNGFGYDDDSDADPDTFKVEVTDPKASGNTVDVTVRALKPVYRADGTVERHEVFTGAGANLRTIQVRCQQQGKRKILRSRYLRLVADEQDLATLSGNPPRADGTAQGLLVTDMADGNGGDADKVEILDQQVEAAYVIQGCKAPDPHKCTLRETIPVGKNRQRIKVCFHIFRTTPGGAAVGGITEKMIRRRTFKWYRRTYAQAELAPKLVPPNIEFVDPPAANMLVISNDDGNSAAGVDASGGVSTLSFRLGRPPGAGVIGGLAAAIKAIADPTVSIQLAAGQTPIQVAGAIVAALPADYSGQAFANAPAFNAVDGSADVIVTRNDGTRVVIRDEQTTDMALTVAVARVNMNLVNGNHPGPSLIPASIDFRAVIRAAAGADDRMDCYVIGQFTNNGLRGRAFVPATDLPAAFQPPAPLCWATVMAAASSSGAVMDGSDNLPFTYPHESGHVLLDAFHTDAADPGGPTELMSGTGTSVNNGLTATKRICDGPVSVRYAHFTPPPAPPAAAPAAGSATTQAINARQRLGARGASVFEAW